LSSVKLLLTLLTVGNWFAVIAYEVQTCFF